jgi:hypothetical protein
VERLSRSANNLEWLEAKYSSYQANDALKSRILYRRNTPSRFYLSQFSLISFNAPGHSHKFFKSIIFLLLSDV